MLTFFLFRALLDLTKLVGAMVIANEQRSKIINIRLDGAGYKSIARLLDLSRDAVRNYCIKIGLDPDYSTNQLIS